MTAFEKQYYEHAGFWTHSAFSAVDRERIDATMQAVPPDAKALLDVGCGNGMFCNSLLESRPELRVVGLDRSEAAVSHVRCEKHVGTIANLPFVNKSFDCVSCLEVIEHLPVDVYPQALSELARVAARWIIVSVPYRENLERNATKCPACRTVFNVDLHLRSYDERIVQELMDAHGFRCEFTQRLGYIERFAGHDIYRKVVAPEPIWRSPLCPLCGYKNAQREGNPVSETTQKTGVAPTRAGRLLANLKRIPKAVWPMVSEPYWTLARYRRA